MTYLKKSPLIVWHFAGDALRDGSPLPKKGDVLPTLNKPTPCERGWHGSVSILDALKYAPGANLSRRGLYGVVCAHGDPTDKHCSSHAVMLEDYRDGSAALIRFARRAALHALRVDAAGALRCAGLIEPADTLAQLADDCDLHAAARAANAADAAYAAADAAADAAYAAAYAAADAAARAAARAARVRLESWLLEEVAK